jgi:aspartate aminotransferase
MQKTKDNKTLCLHFQANPYLCFLLIEEMKLGSDRLQVLEESQTLAISKKVRELKAAGMDILGLTLGEPDFETPEPIRAAAIQAIQEGFTHYPPVAGIPELRKAVAEKFLHTNQIPSSAAQVIISTGAKQSILNAIMVLVNPGEEVILPVPFWVSYAEMVKMAEGKAVLIPSGKEEDFKLSAEKLEAAITPATRMIIFSSPSNPAGAMYSKEELAQLVKVLENHPQVYVLSDEIYEFISYGKPHISIGSFPSIADRVITVNGVSKGFAMTGWRIGFMSAPVWIAELCEKYQGQVTSGACSIAQKAALAAMTQDLGPTHRMTQAFQRRRDLFYDLLKQIPGFTLSPPDGAFYMYPDISSLFGKVTPQGKTIHSPMDFSLYLLEEVGVAVVSGEAFGTYDHIRLSFACSEETLVEAADRIKVAVSRLK